jgi:hypothetical protein
VDSKFKNLENFVNITMEGMPLTLLNGEFKL